MSLFGKKKPEDTVPFRRAMAKKLSGRHIKYVTERDENGESVIGRQGAIIIKDRELLVYSSEQVVFRTPVDEMSAAELLSLEGVILSGRDTENGRVERTVVAYYTYYI